MPDDKGPGPAQNVKSRPPRTATVRRGPLTKWWLLLLVIAAGAVIVLAEFHTTRWVASTGYVITDDETEIRAAVEAPIRTWVVRDGTIVKAGDPLIQLDDSVQHASLEEAETILLHKQKELDRLRSTHDLRRSQLAERVEQAKRTLELRQSQVDRMRKASAGFSPAEIEDAQLRTDIARSELEEAQLDHNELMNRESLVLEGEIDAAQKHVAVLAAQVAQRVIRSPIRGRVNFNSYEPGEVVKPEHVLGQVFDESVWIVKLKLSERDLRYVRVGQPVMVSLTAYPSMRYGYARGAVSRIFNVVTPQSTGDGVFYAEARITNFGQLRPEPGQSARAWVDTGRTSWLQYLVGW